MTFSNLPNELLLNIFLQLHQHDQTECMLVSRHWKRIIEDYVLYRTVLVYSEAAMVELTEKLQWRPDIAGKIERVSLLFDYSKETINETIMAKNNFLSLLTNLKTLHFDVAFNQDEIPTVFSWQNQIKYISGNFIVSHSHQQISFNTYPNLTTLRLPYGFPSNTIFSAIRAAPNLVELSVSSAVIGLDVFDSMHESLPRLKSLKIDCLVLTSGLESIGTITPAPLLIEFMVGFNYSRQRIGSPTPANLLEYIRQKYPNLTTLKYMHKAMRLSNTEVQDINDNGWIPFFQESGSHLKKLSISGLYRQNPVSQGTPSLYIYDDFFEKLDASSCKISHLSLEGIHYELLKKIQNSLQAGYIQTLELINAECGSFEWLKKLSVLRKLKLSYCVHSQKNKKIRMSDIIGNSPPTLVTLSLSSLYLGIDTNYVEKSNITKLTLCLYNTENLPDVFFPQFFPRLSKLKIKDSHLPTRTLNLETMDLLDFQYDQEFSKKQKCTILIEQRKTNERRYYQSKNRTVVKDQMTPKEAFGYHACVPFKAYPADDFNHTTPDVILICNSVKNVAFIW